jgi:competence protein ComEC
MWVALGAGLAAYGAFVLGFGAERWFGLGMSCFALIGLLYAVRWLQGAKVGYQCLGLSLCLFGFIRAEMVMDELDQPWLQHQSILRTQLTAQVISTEQRVDHLLVTVKGIDPIEGIIQLRSYAKLWQHKSMPQSMPLAGERWQFDVRLKRPQFAENPGGFSYERYLYRQNVVALGSFSTAQRLEPPGLLSRWQQSLTSPIVAARQYLFEITQGLKHQALLSALWMGDRQGLTDQQRNIVQQTGTQHLLVVSGMHLSTMAGFAMLVSALLYRLWQGCWFQSAQRQTYWLGIGLMAIFTSLYAALSGFNIPVLRALLMLWLAIWAWWKGLSLRSLKPWSLALGCILLLDPLAIFDAGLYLSFAAVAALLLAFIPKPIALKPIAPKSIGPKTTVSTIVDLALMPSETGESTIDKPKSDKPKKDKPSKAFGSQSQLVSVFKTVGSKFWGYVRGLCVAQLSIGLVMTPLLLILALPLAPQSMWVNFWAIPWVTLWLLPMSWCMLVLHFCIDASWPLTFVDQQLGYFWSALVFSTETLSTEMLSIAASEAGFTWEALNWTSLNYLQAKLAALWQSWTPPQGLMSLIVTQPESLAPNLFGWLLLLVHLGWFLPRSLCPRRLLLPLMLTLWGYSYWQFWLLAQGCVSCQLPGTFEVHVLDVGQGSSALVRTPAGDWLIDVGPKYISGNTQWAMQIQPYITRLGIHSLAGVIVSHADADHAGGLEEIKHSIPVRRWITPDQPELSGLWQQSGVKIEWFRLLDLSNTNDQSFVVLVTSKWGAALFPGDIGREQESRLLKHSPLTSLKSVQLLLAPHHGSQTSSSWEWVKRLQPDWVVFSAGFANAYRHPHPKIEARYQAVGSQTLSTFATGLMVFRFDAGQSWKAPSIYRAHILGRWQRQLNASDKSLTANLDKGE